MSAPVWNKLPFTCPACRNNYRIHATRLLRFDNRWICESCATALELTRLDPENVQAEAEKTDCATCGQPFGARPATINRCGRKVHRRCPPNLRSPRRTRAVRARSG